MAKHGVTTLNAKCVFNLRTLSRKIEILGIWKLEAPSLLILLHSGSLDKTPKKVCAFFHISFPSQFIESLRLKLFSVRV